MLIAFANPTDVATGNVGGGLRYGSVRKRPYRSFGKDSH